MRLPPDLVELARLHRLRQQELARRASAVTAQLWAQVDPADALASWQARLGPAAVRILTAAQVASAFGADDYVAAALAHQNVTDGADGQTSAQALAGIASDGRPLDTLLEQPAAHVDELTVGGMDPSAALVAGGLQLARMVVTQVGDAARVATGVATVAHRGAHGYIRMLTSPSCSRCVILAGKFYRTNQGFQRHPLCDCVHIPAAENLHSPQTSPRAYFDSLNAAEQDKTFTKAGAQAIRDGADPAKVVNARRGMQTASDGRLYTTEAAGRRPRIMPEQIYRDAKDRADAIRLLRLHGYIL
jgi:hypothetical protein